MSCAQRLVCCSSAPKSSFDSEPTLRDACPSSSDAGLKELGGLALKELYLRGTAITDEGLVELKRHKELTLLDVRGTRVTKAGLDEIRKALTKVTISQ